MFSQLYLCNGLVLARVPVFVKVCGHMLDDPEELEKMGRLWKGAKVEIELAPNLLRARWAKLCWNMPFNGLTTILGTLCSRVTSRWISSNRRGSLVISGVGRGVKHVVGSS